MPIPDYQTIMLPLLQTLADGNVWMAKDLNHHLAIHFKLTEDELNEMLPSGQSRLFSNRVGWAKTYLKAAGLLDNPNRGRFSISAIGRNVLTEKPIKIDNEFLSQFEGFREFTRTRKSAETGSTPIEIKPVESRSPLELLEESFGTINAALKNELLTRLKTGSPAFFEYAVLELLKAMGYGLTGDAQLTGKVGDGGIDGIIREDKLGLDIVCVQAKRYAENTVGRPTIQQFSGSMDGHKAKKGVVLTTSSFSNDAIAFVDRIEGKRVVLIDGDRLAELMIQHNVGVTISKSYDVKTLSGDFFDENEN